MEEGQPEIGSPVFEGLIHVFACRHQDSTPPYGLAFFSPAVRLEVTGTILHSVGLSSTLQESSIPASQC